MRKLMLILLNVLYYFIRKKKKYSTRLKNLPKPRHNNIESDDNRRNANGKENINVIFVYTMQCNIYKNTCVLYVHAFVFLGIF